MSNVLFINSSVLCLPTASPCWQVRGAVSEDFICCWSPELGEQSLALHPLAMWCHLQKATEKMPDICALAV